MRSRFSSTLLAMPLALVLGCAGTAPLMAQEDGPTPLQRMLGSFGLLAIPGDTPDIEYRERPPLVVPPNNAELPVPRNPTDITAAVPDWPADPEIARQREQKRYDRLPIDQRRGEFYSGRALTPDELRRGTVARKGSRDPITGVGEEITAGREIQATPKSFFGLFKYEEEKPVAFTGEPPRTRLTEPPVGYQTPSPNAPYGVAEKEKPGTRIGSVYDRLLAPGDMTGPK